MPDMPRTASPRTGARGAGTRRTGSRRTSSATHPAKARRRPTAAQRRSRAARSRRMRVALIVSIIAVPTLTIVGIAILVSAAIHAFDENRWDAVAPAIQHAETTEYDQEQLANASLIVKAGQDLLLIPRDQAIAIMTAMGESSLRNIDYGDGEASGVTNPDGSQTTSIGLFQQQEWWGTREQRLDPHTAATLFYQRMVTAVPAEERLLLEPTEVAHRTQINTDPQHYARYWPAAVRMLETLTGASTGLTP